MSIGRRCATLSSSPSARKFAHRLLPPALTNGSGIPVIGARPIVIVMFSSACMTIIVTTPTTSSRPNGSLVDIATSKPKSTMTPYAAMTSTQPANPH